VPIQLDDASLFLASVETTSANFNNSQMVFWSYIYYLFKKIIIILTFIYQNNTSVLVYLYPYLQSYMSQLSNKIYFVCICQINI
jgi:hypothetical protein